MSENLTQDEEEKTVLPHHIQQPLCTSRLAYRQGRKLTAVKVYTINDESVHLLVFGVPSLNIRQETKALFCKFGNLLQFNLAPQYPAEQFTETYHALFEKIQSARIAKKMIDGKNFYGGILHVCYAPELENLNQTRNKLMQRRRDVYVRLKRNKEVAIADEKEIEKSLIQRLPEYTEIVNEVTESVQPEYNANLPVPLKMNMGDVNVITFGKKRKKNIKEVVVEQKKPKDIEVVDCTQVDKETVTNIYEVLGEKVEVRKVPQKTVNKIQFLINK